MLLNDNHALHGDRSSLLCHSKIATKISNFFIKPRASSFFFGSNAMLFAGQKGKMTFGSFLISSWKNSHDNDVAVLK